MVIVGNAERKESADKIGVEDYFPATKHKDLSKMVQTRGFEPLTIPYHRIIFPTKLYLHLVLQDKIELSSSLCQREIITNILLKQESNLSV